MRLPSSIMSVDGFGGVRYWLRLCRSRPSGRPSICVGSGPGERFRGWDTLVGAQRDERPGVVLGRVWLDGRRLALAGRRVGDFDTTCAPHLPCRPHGVVLVDAG